MLDMVLTWWFNLMTMVAHGEHIDLLSDSFVRDPYPALDELRSETVRWSDRWNGWLVTGYDEVVTALRDSQALSADRVGNYVLNRSEGVGVIDGSITREVLSRWLAFTDPPVHTRLRRLVSRAFTPMSVQQLEPRISAICESLISSIAEQGSEFDVIRDFSYPLPVTVISEMLGVPIEDQDKIKRWSSEVMLIVFMALGNPERHDRAEESLKEISEYLRAIIDKRRAEPKEDVISSLVFAEEHGDALSTEEIIATIIILLFGGHETTTNLIANGMLALFDNPLERKRLETDSALMGSAVEEFLRYDGPVRGFLRWAIEPLALGNKTIGEGDRVLVLIAAANRDPSVFENPNHFDIGRAPNRHVEFGFGIHHCLGAPLARLETSIATRSLLESLPGLERREEHLEWHRTLLSRNLVRLTAGWDSTPTSMNAVSA
jgi:cytochrome P450